MAPALQSLQRDISLGVIALFVLLLAGGIAVVYRANGERQSLDLLPTAHRPLSALPIGAENTIRSPHGFRGPCHTCHPVAGPVVSSGVWKKPLSAGVSTPPWFLGTSDSGTWSGEGRASARPNHPRAGQPPRARGSLSSRFADAAQAAFSALDGPGGRPGLLTPREQNAARKMVVEGHWLGMELMDLTPALRRVYTIPSSVAGVLVDEITLESAESGILAGDVITNIQGRRTRSLTEFAAATRGVSEQENAEVVVNRQGTERRLIIAAGNAPTLGFAQMEGAPPIRPGALSPHQAPRRACTDCHVIMTTGGQLPIDGGDILPLPPPIAAGARSPHALRGGCNACHVIQ